MVVLDIDEEKLAALRDRLRTYKEMMASEVSLNGGQEKCQVKIQKAREFMKVDGKRCNVIMPPSFDSADEDRGVVRANNRQNERPINGHHIPLIQNGHVQPTGHVAYNGQSDDQKGKRTLPKIPDYSSPDETTSRLRRLRLKDALWRKPVGESLDTEKNLDKVLKLSDVAKSPVIEEQQTNGNGTTRKSKKMRKAFAIARVSTDSIDESQDRGPGKRSKPNRLKESPLGEGTDLLRSSDQGSKASSYQSSNSSALSSSSIASSPGPEDRNPSLKTMTLGSHCVTILSPTSSEHEESEGEVDKSLNTRNSSFSITDDDYKSVFSDNDTESKSHLLSSATDEDYNSVISISDVETDRNERLPPKRPVLPSESSSSPDPFNVTRYRHTLGLQHFPLKKSNSDGFLCCSKKQQIVTELLDTEINYVQGLSTILEVFSEPLKQSNILSRRVHSILFPHTFTALLHHHSVLLGRLQERLASWNPLQTVADLFYVFDEEKTGCLFDLYMSYIINFPMMFEKLTKITQNSERFRQFLQKTRNEESTCNRLSLLSFIYSPIQRLPRYLLILKAYKKHLEIHHFDYSNTDEAIRSLDKLLVQANTSCMINMDGGKNRGMLRRQSFHSSQEGDQYPDAFFKFMKRSQSDEQSDHSAYADTSDAEAYVQPSKQHIDRKKSINKKFATLLNVLSFNSAIKRNRKSSSSTTPSIYNCSHSDSDAAVSSDFLDSRDLSLDLADNKVVTVGHS